MLIGSKLNAKQHIEINFGYGRAGFGTDGEEKLPPRIKDYVLEHSGLKVSRPVYRTGKAEVLVSSGENYNKPKSEGC